MVDRHFYKKKRKENHKIWLKKENGSTNKMNTQISLEKSIIIRIILILKVGSFFRLTRDYPEYSWKQVYIMKSIITPKNRSVALD